MFIRPVVITVSVVHALSLPTLVLAQAATPSAASQTDAASTKAQLRAGNRALSRSVRKSLLKVKGIDISRITVLANGGVVTLVGNVLEQHSIEAAGTAAAATAGVSDVRNNLTVGEMGH